MATPGSAGNSDTSFGRPTTAALPYPGRPPLTRPHRQETTRPRPVPLPLRQQRFDRFPQDAAGTARAPAFPLRTDRMQSRPTARRGEQPAPAAAQLAVGIRG
jgi:hypothetical protein